MKQHRWAYGVTTCPKRRDNLLPQTLTSLARAGFDRPRLFVDGDPSPSLWNQLGPSGTTLEVTCHYPALRLYGNWVLSLAELYLRDPGADYYALFQDDVLAYPHLRQYLERCPFPAKGYWNLYCYPPPRQAAPPVRYGTEHTGWFLSNQRGRGALGLVFNYEGVHALLTHSHTVEHARDSSKGWRNIDGSVVSALGKAGYSEWVHHPSLVQHTGDVSSHGGLPHAKAASWRGEDFDALSLLPSTS